jgi:cadmium resistance protein CadD (predicted permease)
VSENSVIWDTELFYAVILKSIKSTEDNCDVFVPENERLEAQALFPDRKVFANRCYDIENLFYTNVDPKFRIMAVYAGSSLAEANRVLASVKSSGKFPGAYLRRMRTGFNGT